jgi:hypothetical protein
MCRCDVHHHHHQITKLSHSINAIGPAPHRCDVHHHHHQITKLSHSINAIGPALRCAVVLRGCIAHRAMNCMHIVGRGTVK